MAKLSDLKLQFNDYVITAEIVHRIAAKHDSGLTRGEVSQLFRDACAAVKKGESEKVATMKMIGYLMERAKNRSYNDRVSLPDTEQEKRVMQGAAEMSSALASSLTQGE